jgi:hypothetical protein
LPNSHDLYGKTIVTQPNHPETPWHLMILRPNATRCCIGRYHNRQEAEASLRIMRRLVPNATYEIVFVSPDESGETHETNA